MPLLCHGPHGFQNRMADRARGLETRLETPNTAIFLLKLFTFFRIGLYKLVDLYPNEMRSSIIVMRDNCSAAPRLQHCVEITSVSLLSRSRLG